MHLRVLSILRQWFFFNDLLFNVAPIICWGSLFSPYYVFVVLSVLSSFAIILMGKSELTVFLMSCDSQCSVALPHSAQGWYGMCN